MSNLLREVLHSTGLTHVSTEIERIALSSIRFDFWDMLIWCNGICMMSLEECLQTGNFSCR